MREACSARWHSRDPVAGGASGRARGKGRSNPIFRLSVSLVQLDAVVTDRKGHHVTDLGPSDFLVMQDGRPQPVTAVAYVRADEHLLDDTGTPIVSRPASPRDARRVIALIVDDSRMSFESIARTRTVLRRFVDEQLMPDDLVCFITTSGGIGAKWDFTYRPCRAQGRRCASEVLAVECHDEVRDGSNRREHAGRPVGN